MNGHLDAIMKPRSIAVIGASRSANTIGNQILGNLVKHGFTGPVYPVNPSAHSIHSIRAWPNVSSIPDPVDTAVVVVPRHLVLSVAEECGEAGVQGLVVITAGFREVGGDGERLETELMEIVRRYDMRMIGPNCMGVINCHPDLSMNGTFAPAMPPFGGAAFVSQSGALGASVLDYASGLGIGISQFVSVGNKPDVSGNDLLVQWEHDPSVTLIMMYVESFGNPRNFLDIAGRITPHKPIIVVKSGRSQAGARAASSHTGALAASDAAVDALFAQSGVIRATSIEEMFDIATAFTDRPTPKSRGVAVVTNAGGPGILAADALAGHDLDVVELQPATVERLRPLFPPEASVRNPLDMIASATPSGYRAALDAILKDDRVDSIVAIFVPPLGVRQEDVAEAIGEAASGHPTKTVLAVLMGREGLPQGRAQLHLADVPSYVFPEAAARALAAICRYSESGARPVRSVPAFEIEHDRAREILSAAIKDGRDRLTEQEALDLLISCGIPTPTSRFAETVDDAATVADEIGYPVVMKIVAPDVTHKTDVGGVRTDISNEMELRETYLQLMSALLEANPEATADGVLIQKMIRGGRETIMGVTRDPSFGTLLMFGLGGVFVEALKDVTFRIAPIGEHDAREMIRGIRSSVLLGEFRGQPGVDTDALAETLLRLSQLAIDFPQIEELDINPLVAMHDGIIALDARVQLQAG